MSHDDGLNSVNVWLVGGWKKVCIESSQSVKQSEGSRIRRRLLLFSGVKKEKSHRSASHELEEQSR